MKALILAAGRGSRMGHLTEEVPKCLTHFAGKPLLEWQTNALRAAGIMEIGVVRGYRAHLLERPDLTPFDNSRWAETNMVASLTCARAWLAADPVVVSYSDIFYPAAAVRALMAAPGDIAITYDPDWLAIWSRRFADPLSDAETFRTEDGRVVDIGRKTISLDDIQGQYMGLLKFTPAGWAAVENYLGGLTPERQDRLDMTSLLSGLIAADQKVQAVAVSGPWGEVDSKDDLDVYEAMVRTGAMSLADLR